MIDTGHGSSVPFPFGLVPGSWSGPTPAGTFILKRREVYRVANASSICTLILSLALIACAPPINIPADDEVDRIEIRDQNAIHSREDLLNPTKAITDRQQIAQVLDFLRQRNRLWSPPLFETPGSRYSVGFYKGDKFQFVIWPRGDGLCGRNDDEEMHDNRCRSLVSSDVAEFYRLLEIE